jgi:hypothetical protein
MWSPWCPSVPISGIASQACRDETASDAGRLRQVEAAFQKLRSGRFTGDAESGDPLIFRIDGVEFVTAQPVLDGKQGDISNGGSGLDTWP